MIFYFTGTGNSLWVANQISEILEDTNIFALASLHDTDREFKLAEGEALGFVFPVYSWGPPQIVLDFIDSIDIRFGGSNFIYFVCTCGDDTGRTSDIMRKSLQHKGWKLNAGYSVILPNTYVCLPGFDIDKPEIRDRKLKESVARVKSICDLLIRRVEKTDCNEGGMPWVKSYIIRPLFNKYFVSSRKFHVTEKCISCGRCVNACPVGNITIADGRPLWNINCTMCLSCYHNCPVHAIEYGNSTKNKGQYVHK